jgi:thioredoxin 2
MHRPTPTAPPARSIVVLATAVAALLGAGAGACTPATPAAPAAATTADRTDDLTTTAPRVAPGRRIVEADDASFDAVVGPSPVPLLVGLSAPWCQPCRTLTPELEHVVTSHAGALVLVKVNIDDAPAVAQRYGVQSIPTVLLIDRGEVVARQTRGLTAPALEAWLRDALAARS